MSQGDSLHRFRIRVEGARPGGGASRELDLRMARHASETPEYLLARLVARILFDDPLLQVASGVCRGEEPELSLTTPGGRLSLWVEIGTPKPERVEHALRRAERVVVLVHRGAEPFVRGLQAARLRGKGTLEVRAFVPEELAALARALERDNRWTCRLDGDGMEIEIGGRAHALSFARAI